MKNTYNIYKVNPSKIDELKKKIATVGLKEQKTKSLGNYSLTFYFSENLDGNEIWWWQTYREFFNAGVKEPKNLFHFGLLLCINKQKQEQIYAVSLGKAHFYLSKFIQHDFGIDLAIRMADENTVLLKKSRYFAGTKRQDVSSYQRFQPNSYEPGESVDHLKLRASDTETWGAGNIIFADSIQLDSDCTPTGIPEILSHIEQTLSSQEIIKLPKLELVNAELGKELDALLFKSLKERKGDVHIEEFYVYGVAICFSFHDYDYRISARKSDKSPPRKKNIGNSISIAAISEFLNEFNDVTDINAISVQFKNGDHTKFTKALKEILDLPITHDSHSYFLRNGDWYRFNQAFMDYLKASLDSIDIVKKQPLVEAEYIAWREEKERKIEIGEEVEDSLLYREAYFNKKQCKDHGYTLMDRQLTQIKSLEERRRNYQIEVADLFKDGEIISVKVSQNNQELIYNIEQSRDAVELIKRGTVEFEEEIASAALWFVFGNDVERITEFNSIQFLLAIESWRKTVIGFGMRPKIYISKHLK